MLKPTKFESLPPEIEENPRSGTRIEELGLVQRTERELRKFGFQTAGQVASRSAEELQAFSYLTPAMIAEIEDALGRLGLALRVE